MILTCRTCSRWIIKPSHKTLGIFRNKTKAEAFLLYLHFLPIPLWLFWRRNNLWGWRKREKSSGINTCRSVKVLDPCLHFGAAKKSVQRWHVGTWRHLPLPRSIIGQRNQRQIAFSISWTRQEPRGLVGSSVISDPAVPGSNSAVVNSLFLCHFFFLKVRAAKNFKVFHIHSDDLRTCAPVKSIKTSQQVIIKV